jgi:hypothetical protein
VTISCRKSVEKHQGPCIYEEVLRRVEHDKQQFGHKRQRQEAMWRATLGFRHSTTAREVGSYYFLITRVYSSSESNAIENIVRTCRLAVESIRYPGMFKYVISSTGISMRARESNLFSNKIAHTRALDLHRMKNRVISSKIRSLPV